MNNKRVLILLVIAAMLFAALACEISFGRSTEEEVAAQLTMQALQQTQTAMAKPPEPEEEAPAPEESEPEPAAEEEEEASDEECYYSQWTGDETIPDGTQFDPGDAFTKSWTLRNAGTCEWTTGARMEFEDGTQMGGASSVYLTHDVQPGETYTIEIPMTAPSSDGDYTGVWRFKAADGTKMGKYWVKITVGEPPAAFAVTSVSYTIADTSIEITCPGNEEVTITANITTSAGGNVSFKWDDSQGCSGCVTKSTTFDSAGTKSISHVMTVGAAGDYWAKIYIDEPNHQWFGQQNFHVECE